MKIIYNIKELAQEFLEQPKIERNKEDVNLIFDFEKEDGTYGKTGICFKNCLRYNVVKNIDVTAEYIEAYNSIAVEENSKCINEFECEEIAKYWHFKIYFDGFGLYEFIAQSFIKLDEL